tara:strand:+ start:679 stop:957 length:279 start_codon:yes stop_codon:yes gene_type:complete
MKKEYILLCVIFYITILSPLISFLGNFLLAKYVHMSELPFYTQMLGIPFAFIPLAISSTIEKGYIKIGAFILSALYILYRLGIMIYFSIYSF